MKSKLTLSAFIVSFLAVQFAHAIDPFWDYYEPHPTNFLGSEEWWHGDALSGDWWGVRNWLLEEEGVEFSFTYTTDLAGNPVGGMSQDFTYTDNIAFGLKLYLEKLVGWRGATFTIAATQRNGVSLSEKAIGNQFTVQQIYGGQTIIFTTMHLEQKFWDDKANIKLGWFSSGDDFASSPLYWLYMNNGIDGNPQALPVNSSFSAYPWASWATRLRLDPSPEWNAQFGLYQVSNRTFNRTLNGFGMDFRHDDGVMFLSQLGWTPEFFKRKVPKTAQAASTEKPDSKSIAKTVAPTDDEMRGLPGHYWVGGYYSTWNSYSQFNSNKSTDGAYGFYWHADQMVFQEAPGSDQGLTLWTAFVYSPQSNIAKMPFQWNSGAVYRGLIPSRNKDITMFGLAYGQFSDKYSQSGQAYEGRSTSYEMALEFGYRVQINSFLYAQPNLQYIVQPGGTGSIPNALVLGLQVGVAF